ncbi:MAG TPA: SLC13 family permease [Terracidiphilus sp.]|jgi:arsenical pump membrane protein
MAHLLIWTISALSILLMLFRPFKTPEVVWTAAGAILLCVLRLISLNVAFKAVAEGLDVYLFLTGMMLLSELGKANGVFSWLANVAVKWANRSEHRLFTLIYAVGTVVTVFMSNDATAVVLTPAVLAAVKRAKAEPLPYLLSCAFVANAASFVLPISNPANLVVFNSTMPPLVEWLKMFAVPSLIAIVITYLLLRWISRKQLMESCKRSSADVHLSRSGKITLFGIIAVAVVLLVVSALKIDLGLPTCLAAIVVTIFAVVQSRTNPIRLVREISWGILPLVASLFVIVEAVKSAGALEALRGSFERVLQLPHTEAALGLGAAIAFGTDVCNNLPLGLITGATLRSMTLQPMLARVVLIAIDLGPNLSITGSLATILWLISIRREGLHVSAWQFFKIGMIVMPISLLFAILAVVLI